MQTGFDVAVVIPTTLRDTLSRAVRSVFAQDLKGRIQVLIGVDVAGGDASQLQALRDECPAPVTLTVFDPGYSTSQRHGGLYPNAYGGALRTILSFAANSRYVAYLDDDDWFAPDHLSSLLAAIKGKVWAHSYRWLVDDRTGWVICRDEWDAVGVGRGINQERYGGFVNPSSLMIDKMQCQSILHLWSNAMFADGSGEDRLIFQKLLQAPYSATGLYTSYFQMTSRNIDDDHHVREFVKRGILWPQQRELIAVLEDHARRAATSLAAGDTDAAIAACKEVLAINLYHAESLKILVQARLRDNS
jgi:hypothetical protein